MSVKSRYKWIRAPLANNSGNPDGYFRDELTTMRQIPGLLRTVTSAGGGGPVFTAYVPANSWGLNKAVLIRGIYNLSLPAGPFPPGWGIAEAMAATGGITQVLPTNPLIIPAGVLFSTYIERVFIRFGTSILCFDRGDCMKHNFGNTFDGIAHVKTMNPVAGPFNYTAQIQLDLNFTIAAIPAGATLAGVWMEVLMEQATNLGKLA